MDIIARQTSGLTGADLANICNEAAIFAGRDQRDFIRTKDFQAALERVIAGMQSRRVITEHEKKVVAYHEAGHALCSELLPSVEKVHRISIVPRGKALGYTLNLPEEDRYLKTKEELMDYMVVLLGGRVTEHIVFGEVTTGAADDLQQGPRDQPRDGDRVRHGHGARCPSRSPPTTTRCRTPPGAWSTRSSSTSPTWPTAARWRWCRENRTLLEGFAFTLLQNEVLEREDIERIVASYKGENGSAPIPRRGARPGHDRRVRALRRRS